MPFPVKGTPTSGPFVALTAVDHLFDRSRFASLEGPEIGLAHLAEREIVPVLAHVPQNFWRGGLGDRQA
jgi:hypothetical protein